MNLRLLSFFIFGLLIIAGCENKKKQNASFESIDNFMTGRSSGFIVEEDHYDSLGMVPKGLAKRYAATFPEVGFVEKEASLAMVPTKFSLPDDWTDADELIADLENLNNIDVKFELAVRGEVGLLGTTAILPAHKTSTVVLDLHDLALVSKMDNMYKPEYIQIKSLNEKPAKIKIHEISLTFNKNKDRVVMDKFGQRKSTEWKGKVKSADELKKHRQEESLLLAEKSNKDLDEFGGWKKGPSLEATGFYRIKKRNGKYWFITPGGKLFWSFGVNGVRPKIINTATTHIAGREFLFEETPPTTGRYAQAWTSPEEASFYCWNALRKYDKLERWRDAAYKRLDAWGYNTIGNWSDDSLLYRAEFPFTYSFRTTLNKNLVFNGNIPDVYNPAWEEYIDSVFTDAERFADNPWLVGYFVDNEAGWGDLNLPERMTGKSSSRKAWLEFVQKKYPSVREVNKAWKSSFKSWNDIKLLNTHLEASEYQKDMSDFESAFAEKYFYTIRKSLKKHDPNHLYMGCRFTRRIKPLNVCQAAGKYCDVVTVNVYARVPDEEVMGEWYRRTGKPILIGEHHINLKSPRQIPARWGASTPEERVEYYKNYVETWAKTPYSLGCHWYQYTDQHITGRGSNGENQCIGLVDISDQPHQELIKTAQELSRKIYKLHFETQEALLSLYK